MAFNGKVVESDYTVLENVRLALNRTISQSPGGYSRFAKGLAFGLKWEGARPRTLAGWLTNPSFAIYELRINGSILVKFLKKSVHT